MALKEKTIYKNRYLILLFCCLFAGIFNILQGWQKNIENHNQILFLVSLVILFFVYLRIFGIESFGERQLIFLIFAVGFIFRLVYTQSTGYLVRQHDVGGTNGHLEYIQRLYNGEGLADTVKWQYYQPPAWHWICSLWLKIQTFFGVEYKAALENLQLISLFCSSAIMFLSHKLFKMFNLSGYPLCIACGIIAFHPTFIILSASINNDVLSLTLAVLSVILALKWYRNPSFPLIISLGFTIGLSMAVKLSGGLIALGIAILFAVRFFGKKYKSKLKLFVQFICFGIICVPMALWWQFRNLIKFDVPLTYVPMLSETNSQYIGFRTVSERLFDFSSLWENGVYPARVVKTQSFEYFEFNIPLGALKSSVFGEYYLGKGTPLEIIANILFYSAAILAIFSIIASIFVIFKAIKEKNSPLEKIYPFIISATLIFSYVKFCFDFAHFCTMDFRYIAITVIFGALYIGLLLKETQNNNKIFGRILAIVIAVLTVLMSVSSILIYGTIA